MTSLSHLNYLLPINFPTNFFKENIRYCLKLTVEPHVAELFLLPQDDFLVTLLSATNACETYCE